MFFLIKQIIKIIIKYINSTNKIDDTVLSRIQVPVVFIF